MPSPRILPILLVAALLGACSETPVATKPPAGQAPGNYVTTLESLTVAPERPMTKYSRDRFPHWRSAGSNCDVRDTVLARDGKNVKKSGCNVTGGEWFSVYDNVTVKDPADVDIDHMVPLANAWRSGADEWNDDKRSDFANDLERPQLFAVTKSSNRSKGDQNPAQWKPPNKDYYCQYAQHWITVKSYWKLTVTADEKRALSSMLGTCV
ncbi:HNH endonuclease family protein [Allorhizocola rhizosphaerae]|uniref:HNH endonuclease family protein n=1 Tax=Allorhizocola rhizosphaerae TaxID=1872709 RepID=UPI001FE65E27|nr:HNH endonuclease family protein [Allorhizocola rhizosphaerae]